MPPIDNGPIHVYPQAMQIPVVPPFYTIEISRLAHALKTTGKSIIHMEFGQPSAGPPQAARDAATVALRTDAFGYWTSLALKERLVQHYLETYKVSLTLDQIILTSGASGGLVLAFTTLFKAGDAIAMTRPGYAPYRNALLALGLCPQEIPVDAATRYCLTPALLDALDPIPKGLIIASPANPTGSIIPETDLRAIVEICARKNIILLSDEIYHGLSYGPRCHSVLEFTQSAFVINSFSKYFCMPGWRLGWMVVPSALGSDLQCISDNLFLTPSGLAQHGALAAMDARDELDKHIIGYEQNRAHILSVLGQLGISNIAPPDGAFYIYADIGAYTNDSMEFCRQLVSNTGLVLAPGKDFDPTNGHRFVRFSFAVSTDECIDAMQRFVLFIKK
jgi:aspartate/methionine/tyrosine aminotransferase